MEELGIVILASNDSDFKRIKNTVSKNQD